MDTSAPQGILQYESVKRWLLNVQGNSLKLYPRYFREFCQFAELTPEGVLAKTDADVHNLAKQFYDHLAKQGLSSWTCTIGYACVRSFMKWNDRRLGPMPKKFAGHVMYESDRVLQPQEVARLIDHASTVRNKGIISFLHQSAQRAGILTALRYGDIREQVEKGVSPVVIDIKGILLNSKGANVNKKKVRYKFALGSETVGYLKRMIDERRQEGEQVTDDSWLFTSNNGNPIGLKVVMQAVKTAAKRAGLQVVKNIPKSSGQRGQRVKAEIHSHIFRRTWKHSMRSAGVTDADLLNFMIGHELSYGGAYDKYSADYIRKEYAKAEPKLTVMVSPEIVATQERDNLVQEYVQVKGRNPAQDFPEYATWTIERQVRFLKPVVGKASMARAASTKQVLEAIKPTQDPSQHDCQRVITEGELDAYLANGWHFVKQLQSGKIVVED